MHQSWKSLQYIPSPGNKASSLCNWKSSGFLPWMVMLRYCYGFCVLWLLHYPTGLGYNNPFILVGIPEEPGKLPSAPNNWCYDQIFPVSTALGHQLTTECSPIWKGWHLYSPRWLPPFQGCSTLLLGFPLHFLWQVHPKATSVSWSYTTLTVL